MDTCTLTAWTTLYNSLMLRATIRVPCATPTVPAVPVPAVPTVPSVPAVPSIPAVPVVPVVPVVPIVAAAPTPAVTDVSSTPTTPTTPATPPRRSQRLLNKLRFPVKASTPPAGLTSRKRSSRTRKRPCHLCKGKKKATPAPIQIRLGITSKVQLRGFDMVEHVHMGFRYLGQDEEDEGKTTLLLTLGADIKSEELVGLDRMEVDIRLGFAKA